MTNQKYAGTWPQAYTNLPRFSAVVNACNELRHRDEKITRSAIRELIGGGSDRDIAPVIKIYQTHQEYLANHEQLPADIASLVLQSLESYWQLVADRSKEAINLYSEEVSKAIEASNEENLHLDIQLKGSSKELERANETISLKEQSLELASIQLEEQAQALEVLEEKYQSAISSIQERDVKITSLRRELSEQIESSKMQVETLKKQAKESVEDLKSVYENEANRLLRQIDTQKIEHNSALKKLDTQSHFLSQELIKEKLKSTKLESTIENKVLLIDQQRTEINGMKSQIKSLSIELKSLKRTARKMAKTGLKSRQISKQS